MQQFSNYKSYKENFIKNKISLVYSTKTKSNPIKIELLIENILNKKNSFIFESVEEAIYRGRYTIFGYDSDKVYEVKNNSLFINKKKIKTKKIYEYLKKLIKNFDYDLTKNLPPMALMLVGYFGYDAIRFVEKIPNKNKDDLKIPDVRLQRPRKIIIHDNLKKKLFFISCEYDLKKCSKLIYNKKINE